MALLFIYYYDDYKEVAPETGRLFLFKGSSKMKNVILKRVSAMVLSGALSVAMFAGCGKAKSASSGKSDEKKPNLLMWDGDCSEKVVKNFEKKYGVVDCQIKLSAPPW